jgi:NAD(P)-dependent dehydrogenase (short-subunit alcohol dehydrogenase family)
MSQVLQGFALVTGAGSGIGAALVERLARSGAHVLATDVDVEAARRVASRAATSVEPGQLDVAEAGAAEALLERACRLRGPLELVINCAGIQSYGEMCDISADDWNRLIGVNLMGTIRVSLAAYRIMRSQGRGVIVNVGSASTFLQPPLFGPYVSSKAGVLAFTRALALEAESSGVSVCVVCPGNVATPMSPAVRVSRFTPAISPDAAARRILTAIASRKRISVFPLYARLFWWLDRASPHLLDPLRREILRRARRRVGQ